MLDDLVGVIETLQQRIRDHGTALRENETRTRMALIDPLLTALGWDVSDPGLVTPEYNVSGRWADYALLGPDGKPAATVEAKKLGESLASHRMQMLNYSNASGVEYAGLTDGDHWELYEVFQRGQLEDRRILDISIANTPAYQCALQLLLLWRPNLVSGQPMAANEPLLGLATVPHTAAREVPPAIETLRPIVPEADFDSTGWVPMTDFNPPSGTKPPAAIKFPDGVETKISRWKQIPKAVADWLYAKRLLTLETLPIASRGNRFFANHKPIMRDGKPMVVYEPIGSGDIFINVDLSANSTRLSARKMLEHCGIDPATVQLQVEQ